MHRLLHSKCLLVLIGGSIVVAICLAVGSHVTQVWKDTEGFSSQISIPGYSLASALGAYAGRRHAGANALRFSSLSSGSQDFESPAYGGKHFW